MPEELITESIDLSKPPGRKKAGEEDLGICLTLGDLHGNALKLIYSLIDYGILYNISDGEYLEFHDTYYSSFEQLKKEKLIRFLEILKKAKVKSDKFLRLLGDETSDRGCNDYFTLKIIEKIVSNGADIEVILSNHGVELIDAYLENREYRPAFILQHQTTSMLNMQKAIDQGIIERKEVDAIIKNCLVPNLKTIGYRKVKNSIDIYTHAPIGLTQIQLLSSTYNIFYDDRNIKTFGRTLNKINKHVSKALKNKKFVALHKDGAALNTFLWNREVRKIHRPQKRNKFTLGYRHGHHNKGKSKYKYVFNLDDTLGKAEQVNNQFKFNPQGDQRFAINKRDRFQNHGYFYNLVYKNFLTMNEEAFTNYLSVIKDGIFDINTYLFEKDSLLSMAIKEGHTEYAKSLIVHGADTNNCSKKHIKGAFSLACFCGELALAEWLYQRDNTVLNEADTHNRTPFYWACLAENTESAEFLITKNVNIKACVKATTTLQKLYSAYYAKEYEKALKYTNRMIRQGLNLNYFYNMRTKIYYALAMHDEKKITSSTTLINKALECSNSEHEIIKTEIKQLDNKRNDNHDIIIEPIDRTTNSNPTKTYQIKPAKGI